METERGSTLPPAQRGPRILYLCNSSGEGSALRVLYQHVALLRQLGLPASLGAYQSFARCHELGIDATTVPGVSYALTGLRPEDIVVLPELSMRDRELQAVRCRQFVLVQNPDLMTGPARDPRFERLLVPSRPLVAWIRNDKDYTGPIEVISGCIETGLLAFPPRRAPGTDRPLRFLVVDRNEAGHDAPTLAHAALRAAGEQVTFVDHRLPRAELLALFASHDLYLHLASHRGFPVAVLEAAALGCLTVGFAGRGGLEFLGDRDNCRLVTDGDWQGAVAVAQEVAAMPREAFGRMLARARATAAAYTESRSRNDLQRVFGQAAGAAARDASS